MNKYVATAGVSAALVAGSLALTVVNPLTLAGAQNTTTSTEQVAPEAAPEAGAERVHPLDAALSELVAEGTITQEQADAVTERTEAKREELGERRPGRGGPGGRGGFGGFEAMRETADAIAGQLGITADELKDALMSGTSLNDLAAEKGVDPAGISQTIIDAANARIDAAVTDGKLTQEQADDAKAKLSENIASIMDGSIKGFGHGGGRPPAGDAPAEDGAN